MDIGAQELFDLPESAIDALPFGLISVDADGTIRQYNAYESRMARLPKDRVIGRNFFRDVAPCLSVHGFQGRFERFLEQSGDAAESFDFEFRFAFRTSIRQHHLRAQHQEQANQDTRQSVRRSVVKPGNAGRYEL